jgi:tripartite-type tricarboxylate transporter receptor subunit TctC
MMRIARDPEVIARLRPLGILPLGNSSAEFARVLSADIARWTEVTRAGHIRIEQ